MLLCFLEKVHYLCPSCELTVIHCCPAVSVSSVFLCIALIHTSKRLSLFAHQLYKTFNIETACVTFAVYQWLVVFTTWSSTVVVTNSTDWNDSTCMPARLLIMLQETGKAQICIGSEMDSV